MPISGLVVTLSPEPHLSQAAVEALRRHPAIEVGEGAGQRLPIVAETADSEATSELWEWLNSLPGVLFVDVAFLNFEDDEAFGDPREEARSR